ncbi:MAG: hypothetical protein GF331_05240 [Chitinivibrionales bacterium]|nr:hypothetical protein [Chitinivibrionales bacterium]
MISDTLNACIGDLDRRLLPDVEEDLERQWRAFTDGAFEGDVFTPSRLRSAVAPAVEWPAVSINDAQRDIDAMLLHQCAACSGLIQQTGGHTLGVRCNYGVGIMPSLFGAEIRLMSESQANLPTSVPLGPERAAALLDRGVPDIRAGLGGRVFETAERFLEVLNRYPSVGRFVHLYHPDLQGPMDTVEMLWGSDLFTAVYLCPDTVRDLLELVTETYIVFMREWERLTGRPGDGSVHWQLYHRGQIMLRDDSAMNFPPELFDTFIRPYDQRLLHEFGGGAVHFCGRGDHYIASLCEMDGLYAVNMSQPELNDMEVIYVNTVDKGIPLLGLRKAAADDALAAGRPLRGLVHAV